MFLLGTCELGPQGLQIHALGQDTTSGCKFVGQIRDFSSHFWPELENALNHTIWSGGVLTVTPSRSQFLKFLVGCVLGGKPRLSGKNHYGLHCTFRLEMEWRHRFPENNCDTQKRSNVVSIKRRTLAGKTSWHEFVRRSWPRT